MHGYSRAVLLTGALLAIAGCAAHNRTIGNNVNSYVTPPVQPGVVATNVDQTVLGLQNSVSDLEKQVGALSSEIELLRKDRKTTQATMAQLGAQMAGVSDSLARLSSDVAALRDRSSIAKDTENPPNDPRQPPINYNANILTQFKQNNFTAVVATYTDCQSATSPANQLTAKAMLKVAAAYHELHNTAGYRSVLQRIVSEYAGTLEAKNAQQRLDDLDSVP